MAAYLTSAEFLDQTIPGDAFSGLTSTQVSTALEWCSSFADSYLTKRYSLPLVSWGSDLKSAVGNIAQYELLSRRGFRPGSGNDIVAKDRRDAAVAWLRDVSNGVAGLADAIDSTPAVDEEGPLAASQSKTSFSMTTGRRCDTERDL